MGAPGVAATALHPAPPQSFTVFLAGCNFRCLNCQNWRIAHRGVGNGEPVEPVRLAERAVEAVNSGRGRMIGADRVFFSGGSPTPSLPYVERVVEEVGGIGDLKFNYDTNGFLTEETLDRVLDLADSVTFDVKAFDDGTHRALTGAPVGPVLRNAETVATEADDLLWEFRYLLIPGVNCQEVGPLAKFLADIDEGLPLQFLAFRPEYVLESHPAPTRAELGKAVEEAKSAGLRSVGWSGRPGSRKWWSPSGNEEVGGSPEREAREFGCRTRPRDCGSCGRGGGCPFVGS